MLRLDIRALAACVALGLWPGTAPAHDHWINHGGYLEYGTSNHCCGPEDCAPWPAADIDGRGDGYTLRSTGEFVPGFKAQSGEDGDYWVCRKSTGAIRCFFTPSPGA